MFLSLPPSKLTGIYKATVSPEKIETPRKEIKIARKLSAIFCAAALLGVGGTFLISPFFMLMTVLGGGLSLLTGVVSLEESSKLRGMIQQNRKALADSRSIMAQIEALETAALPAPAMSLPSPAPDAP